MKARFLYNGQKVAMEVHSEQEYISRYILNQHQFYETPLLEYLKQYKPKCFVDVGSNIGNHSLFFHLNGTKEIHAFEPQIDNYRLLELNCPFAKKHNVALGDREGVGSMTPYALNMGACRVEAGEGVEILTLDGFGLNPDLIKIDAEDMEVDVIRGAMATIEKCKPRLVVEHNNIENLYETYRLLQPLGYNVKPFVERTWEVFEYAVNNNSNQTK